MRCCGWPGPLPFQKIPKIPFLANPGRKPGTAKTLLGFHKVFGWRNASTTTRKGVEIGFFALCRNPPRPPTPHAGQICPTELGKIPNFGSKIGRRMALLFPESSGGYPQKSHRTFPERPHSFKIPIKTLKSSRFSKPSKEVSLSGNSLPLCTSLQGGCGRPL